MEEEQTAAPSAEASAPEPVTFDSALEALNAQDTPAPEPEAAADPEPEQADQAEDVAPSATDEAAPEAEDEEPEVLHGNARTRLRDGSVVTVGELKKAYDEAKEYRVNQAKFAAERQEFEAKQAQIAQAEQQTQRLIQQAKSVLQANFPPKPDPAALQRGEIDAITYTEQKAAWDAAAEKWHALNHAERAAAQKAEEEKATATRTRIMQEREAFLTSEHGKDLHTEEAQRAFAQSVQKIAKDYGATDEQLNGLTDAWVLKALKDAIAYRKLQAEKPKVLEKVKDVPPVQAPGRRMGAAEKQAATLKDEFGRVRKTGSFDEALKILNQYDL